MQIFSKTKEKVLLFFILTLAVSLRLLGLNWDQNQHLHPDERFLTMVTTAIEFPTSILSYLNPENSLANPYNHNFGFFVYGTFPVYLTKIVGNIFENTGYEEIYLVGRIISAFFDVGVVLLVYKIGKKVYGNKEGLLAAFLYSIMVLPIQLSHFFTSDTFLNFFLVLAFYSLTLLITHHNLVVNSVFLGISFGLALACKISALYFLPIIGLGFIYLLIYSRPKKKCSR
ncbi:MAG: ArnT family glycosyltransferase [Patescibacteria group bacterium]|jgi:asparagine N-glycosylation enzyme membrane subunit Stt3